MAGVLVFLIVAGIVGVSFVTWFSYNRLVTLKARDKNAYAQIDVQMQRRYDFIPNLVATAKGYIPPFRTSNWHIRYLNKAIKDRSYFLWQNYQ